MAEAQKTTPKNSVHVILAHSYSFYLALLLFGLFFHFLFPLEVYENNQIGFFGFLLLVFGTLLILWAQKTSRNLDKSRISKESFSRGPYRYTRAPTHLGLFLLTFGFGLAVNSFFIVLFTLISFVAGKYFFIRKQEAVLSEKYGIHYSEYKKSVKF